MKKNKKALFLTLALMLSMAISGCQSDTKQTVQQWAIDSTYDYYYQIDEQMFTETYITIDPVDRPYNDDYVTNHVMAFTDTDGETYLWVSYLMDIWRFDGDTEPHQHLWVSIQWDAPFKHGDDDLDAIPIHKTQIIAIHFG